MESKVDIGTLLIGMALGAMACCVLMTLAQSGPTKRDHAESDVSQWTVEAAEALAREWSNTERQS